MANAPSPLPVINPPDLEPTYANVARISHTPADLVLDFAHLKPGDKEMRISTRLIMSPVGAKLFYRALGENLAHYEAAFGEIALPSSGSLANELFRSTQPGSGETPAE